MSVKVKNIDQMEEAKKAYQKRSEANILALKESYGTVKKESRKALINNVLIPGAIAVGVFWGLRQIIKSNNRTSRTTKADPANLVNPSPHYAAASVRNDRDWVQTLVKIAPFVWEVGKRLYEEDSLPFIKKHDSPQ